MRAALAALGFDPDRFEAPIMQMVNIVEGGERKRMGKRTGDFVTLDELIDDIGVDATRFFMLQRSHDTPDRHRPRARPVDLAGEPRLLRPVRARADRQHPAQGRRRGGRRLRGRGRATVAAGRRRSAPAPSRPSGALVRRLLELPGEVDAAAERRAPHRLCAYAMATAADFHAFYRDCRVVGAEGRAPRPRGWASAWRPSGRSRPPSALLGVSAPERM